MLKCVLRFTAILKPCNPQTIPPMTCRHYDLRRRGGLEQADDSIDGSDTKETEEEKPTFKGNFKRSPGYSSSLKDSYQERAHPKKERRQLFTKEKSSKQYSQSDNTSTEDNVKDPRLIQYEKWLYDIRKYKESQRTPNFLTWKTKEEIRILNKEDPENWNIERLASKYPVSKASVKQLLKNNWTPRNIQLHDQAALKNWEDFISGKIEIYDEELRDQLLVFARGSDAEKKSSQSLESFTKKLEDKMIVSKAEPPRIIDVHREIPGTPMTTSTDTDIGSVTYPESIVIPKNKYKEGATYRIKDCYYHSDGTFLYKVPGMEQSN